MLICRCGLNIYADQLYAHNVHILDIFWQSQMSGVSENKKEKFLNRIQK